MQPTNPQSLARQAHLDLVASAIKKTKAGKQSEISDKERRAWERYELDENTRRGLQFVAAVPKKTYCEWTGRHNRVLLDQADAYGVPLRGATIDVPQVLRWYSDFFAEFKHVLPTIAAGGEREGGYTPREKLVLEQIEVYKRRVVLLEQKIEREEGELIPRQEIHAKHVQLAKILRGEGEQLHKQFGPQAASILEVALDNFEAVIDQDEPKSDEAAAS